MFSRGTGRGPIDDGSDEEVDDVLHHDVRGVHPPRARRLEEPEAALHREDRPSCALYVIVLTSKLRVFLRALHLKQMWFTYKICNCWLFCKLPCFFYYLKMLE